MTILYIIDFKVLSQIINVDLFEYIHIYVFFIIKGNLLTFSEFQPTKSPLIPNVTTNYEWKTKLFLNF